MRQHHDEHTTTNDRVLRPITFCIPTTIHNDGCSNDCTTTAETVDTARVVVSSSIRSMCWCWSWRSCGWAFLPFETLTPGWTGTFPHLEILVLLSNPRLAQLFVTFLTVQIEMAALSPSPVSPFDRSIMSNRHCAWLHTEWEVPELLSYLDERSADLVPIRHSVIP